MTPSATTIQRVCSRQRLHSKRSGGPVFSTPGPASMTATLMREEEEEAAAATAESAKQPSTPEHLSFLVTCPPIKISSDTRKALPAMGAREERMNHSMLTLT